MGKIDILLRVIYNVFEDTPILVTGSPRCGATWVGNMLALPQNVVYIPEPFQKEKGILTRMNLIKWPFTYVTEENENLYMDILKKSIYIDILQLERASQYWKFQERASLFYILRRIVYERFFSGKGIRALIKDANAIFSAEYLANKFGMNVIILIRHPAGFVSSLKRLNWRFDFQPFLQQKELMEDYLWIFEDEMRKPNKDIIYEGALQWKCFYYVVDKYRERHPEWIFLRHEDLCKNPEKEFEKLYRKLGLPFSMKIRKKILQYSSSKNPVEPPNNEVTYLKRNSPSLIKHWKRRLNSEEIKRIRDIVGELSCRYYSEDEW